MTTLTYRLLTIRSSAAAGMVQETVIISATDANEAVELARSFVAAIAVGGLDSASLTDTSGTVVWREGREPEEDNQPDNSPPDEDRA